MAFETPYQLLYRLREEADVEADRLRAMLLEMEGQVKQLHKDMVDVNERMKSEQVKWRSYDDALKKLEGGHVGESYYNPY